jgi:hypothetical protein
MNSALRSFALIAAIAFGSRIMAAEPDAAKLFTDEVRPLLKAKCLVCHGDDPKGVKGGLDLRTRAAALKGGESGEPAIVPGDPAKSPLFVSVTRPADGLQMPPKENDKLTTAQVDLLKRWIAAGAPWPESTTAQSDNEKWSAASGVTVATSGGRSPEWTNRRYQPEDLWAYQPIRRPAVPTDVIDPLRIRNPIDAFIQHSLKERGITRLAELADERTWLRRVTFDLTGLPPALSSAPPGAKGGTGGSEPRRTSQLALTPSNPPLERGGEDAITTIQRLLASPQYGEQQARHWLDVVRYADTSGFSNDYERPNAWRYRDYVIRSFNADKPFDQFIMEQVAGDELAESSALGLGRSGFAEGESANAERRNPNADSELLIAAGFLRLGPWEHTGMTVAAVTRQQFLDDVTHHIGVTFLGQGLRCAACHDHKFDPVPTQDYYRIQAVFAPVQFVERPLPFLEVEQTSGFAEALQPVQARLKKLEEAQAALRQKNRDAIAAYLREQGVKKLEDLPPEKRPKSDYLGGTFGLSKVELSLRKIYDKQRQYLERELKRFEPYAFSVYSGPPNNYQSPKPLYDLPASRDGVVPVVQILTGGSLESPGDAVTPGILSAMISSSPPLSKGGNGGVEERSTFIAGRTPPYPPSERGGEENAGIPDETHGRRLALAQWIASPHNTLTARVIVNRVWQQHFGQGIVATPNNFGKMGAKPSHPELLDWLATWFIDHGWSLKQLHELIVSSDTYRLAGVHPDLERLREVDSNNSLLAYFPPRRLTAEELRDAMLAVSGELNLQAGGPGVFPELNWEVALQPRHIMGSVAPAYQPSLTPLERNRRTIYAFRYRTLSDPFLEVFNRPGSEVSCDRRDATTVTPQVFALFNSEQVQLRAVAWAASLEQKAPDLKSRIAVAFQQAFHRLPTEREIAASESHYNDLLAHHRSHASPRRELPRSVRRGMVEELTGEMVEWDEELAGMENYVPDKSMADVSPQTRALAEVCLVLLNANEFAYVR